MMVFLREWLLTVIGVTIMSALADCLMPKGPVKEVGRLICGLVLLLVTVTPFLEQISNTDLNYDLIFSESIQKQQTEMKDYYNFQYKTIIEHQFEAYIVDKAMEMGIEIQPVVICFMEEEGVFQPYQVDLGEVDPSETERLVRFVSQDFGLEPTEIFVKEVTYEPVEHSSLE